ncbi:VanW family protein [Patescibacteria group bacterium]
MIDKLWNEQTKKYGRLSLIAIAGLMIFLSGLLSLYHLAYVNKIYPFLSVGSVEMSNLTISEAEERIRKYLPEEVGQVKIKFEEQEWTMDLKDLGVEYLPQETAKEAYLKGRGEGFFKDIKMKWNQWQRKNDQKIKFWIKEEKLVELVAIVSGGVDEEVLKPAFLIDSEGVIEIVGGKNGRKVKQDELYKLINLRIGSLDFGDIQVPVEVMKTELAEEQLMVAKNRGEKMKDKVLSLKHEGFSKKIKGEDLLNLIDFNGGFDEEKIASVSMELAEEINRPAQNPILRVVGKKAVEFKPALKGLKLDEEENNKLVAEKLVELETSEDNLLMMGLIVKVSEPEVQTGEINDLGIKEILGVGESTFHGSIASREHNVALTASKINGSLVAPNEVFSFNNALGDVSPATGFKSAYVIKEGRTVLGDGGGVCQDSTTVFRAALDAGLEIVERHPHSYRVSYYEQNMPAGIDATVYAPSTDLKFRNDTGAHILIQTMVNTGTNYMKVEIYGTSDGRVATISNTKLWGQSAPPEPVYEDDPNLPKGTVKQIDWEAWGARTSFDWNVVRNGEVLHQKTFYSNYQPWRSVYLRGTR